MARLATLSLKSWFEYAMPRWTPVQLGQQEGPPPLELKASIGLSMAVPKRLSGAFARKVQAETLAEVEELAQQAKRSKNEQSLFMTTLKDKRKKGTANKDQLEVLELYEDLAARDPEKHVLLQKWIKDKTCSWSSEYKAQRIVHKIRKETTVDGFGSEWQA
jgi:hypothetical protein